MKFKAGTRRRALEYEKDLVEQWKKNKTFEKSVENRPKSNAYVFYDGPPFISGSPHHGTLLSSIIKDVVPRYQTMKGKRVERVWGWDCHGLPAERFTEKKLGIHSREEVLEYGIEKYIVACRENMVQTSSEWEDTVDRIGRWVDFKGAYKTMDKDYMESVWWAFKELYEKGKIYEGEKVLMYCTLDATPLSKAEVTMDAGAYQDVTDPSVYVKFKVKGDFNIDNFADVSTRMGTSRVAEKPVYLLAWTTTPWTLQANTALAIHPALMYVVVEHENDYYIVEEELAEKIFVDDKHNPLPYKVVSHHMEGIHLADRVKEYEPLFGNRGKNGHKLLLADYVTNESGTGIVHLAPAYGEEDFALAQEMKIPVVHVLDANGDYTEGDWLGQNVWEVNKPIAKELKERGIVWKIEYYRHSYPHCHRCGTRLMYRAHPSWFMDIDSQRETMLEQNGNIEWFPSHVKKGRFAKTVEQAPDWNISRDRFWATAMPVWKGTDKDGNEHVKVVGSYAELKELSGKELNDYHRPWVDDITFEIDGVTYQRIDKVMDSWFEAGSMPFAQFHYPFENKDKFEANFPGDFIVEYIGQVRAWFYYMHSMSVALFGKNSFKNVIVTGNVAGSDGRKMSKSYGNYTDPNELMDKFSADSLRYLLASSPLLNGEDFTLQDKEVGDVARKLSMIWNMYDFFTMYAEVDGWEWDERHEDPTELCKNPLDTWIVSRVHELTAEVEKHMDGYDLPNAMKPILPFIDDASNWYVRRSRRRFWKSGDNQDKDDAYRTLHYVLTQLSMILAPFTPFLAEELHQKLTGGDSVHLLDWPKVGHINELALASMAKVREAINQGLSKRAEAGVKVRQPLSSVKVFGLSDQDNLTDIIAEELNVKSVEFVPKYKVEASDSFSEVIEKGKTGYNPLDIKVELDLELTPELKQEGLMREIVRQVQNARKQAGLDVDDRINLDLGSSVEAILEAVEAFKDDITAETLATSLTTGTKEYAYSEVVKVEGHELCVSLEKA